MFSKNCWNIFWNWEAGKDIVCHCLHTLTFFLWNTKEDTVLSILWNSIESKTFMLQKNVREPVRFDVIWCLSEYLMYSFFTCSWMFWFVLRVNKGLHFDLFIYKVIILLQKTQNILAEEYELISGKLKPQAFIIRTKTFYKIYIFFLYVPYKVIRVISK